MICRIDVNTASFYLDRPGFQIDTDRCAERGTAADVEASLVQGAFDHAVDDDAVFEMFVFVGTEAVGGKETFRGVVNALGSTFVVEAQQVFFVYVIRRAGLYPVFAHDLFRI